jgi:hypothetical protein
MSINHNRIKVADLEKNLPNKILITNTSGELEFSDINNTLDCTVAGKVLDARQGKILKDLIDNINALLTSDNIDLNTVQELVNTIEDMQASLSTLLVNDLTTGGTTKALTAEMGKALKGLMDALDDRIDAIVPDSTYTFTQGIPAKVWTVVHNLNKNPSVTIVDSAGTAVIGQVDYINNSTITLTFASAFSGKAILN